VAGRDGWGPASATGEHRTNVVDPAWSRDGPSEPHAAVANSRPPAAARRLLLRIAPRPPALRIAIVVVLGYLGSTLALLVCGLVLTRVASLQWIIDADTALTEGIARNRVPGGRSVAQTASTWADTWPIVIGALGALAALVPLRMWRLVIVLVAGLTLELSVFLTVNALVDRPRPDVDTIGSVPSTGSFPSGHTAAAVVLFGSFALVYRALSPSRRVHVALRTAVVVVPLLVGAARVYQGLHNPLDVAAGALLGALCLAVAIMASTTVGDEDRQREVHGGTGTASKATAR
jgi:membrane-associated phospholipid phosphatase